MSKRIRLWNIKDMILFYTKPPLPFGTNQEQNIPKKTLKDYFPKKIKTDGVTPLFPFMRRGKHLTANPIKNSKAYFRPKAPTWRTDVKTLEQWDKEV